MELMIIGICFVVLVALIIFGAVQSSKKRKEKDIAHYHISVEYDEPLNQPILSTPDAEGYLFGGTKETGQDVAIREQYPVGRNMDILNQETNATVTETISRVRKHYEPSLAVSGECWRYFIYFKEFENTEFPVEMEVLKHDTIDTAVFTQNAIEFKKNNQVIKSYAYSNLKGIYYNDYLQFEAKAQGSDETTYLNINPGKGNMLDNAVSPDKYYVSSKDFQIAQHLLWKYIEPIRIV